MCGIILTEVDGKMENDELKEDGGRSGGDSVNYVLNYPIHSRDKVQIEMIFKLDLNFTLFPTQMYINYYQGNFLKDIEKQSLKFQSTCLKFKFKDSNSSIYSHILQKIYQMKSDCDLSSLRSF